MQSCLDLALFVFGERADKEGDFHTFYDTTLPIIFGGNALRNNRVRIEHRQYVVQKENL